MPNFMEVLDKKIDDVKRPPLLPVGTYKWVVDGYKTDSIANGEWETLDFKLKLIEPMPDVDEDELNNFGKVQGQVRQLRFMFPTSPDESASFAKTEYAVTRFLREHLQIDGAGKMTIKEGLANCKGHQCLASIVWTQDKKDPSGETHFDNIGRTAPIE